MIRWMTQRWMIRCGLVSGLLMLGGCGRQPAGGRAATPPSVTQPVSRTMVAVRPTATVPLPATRVPPSTATMPGALEMLDLAPLLAQADDLPAGFTFQPTRAASPALTQQLGIDDAVPAVSQPYSNLDAPGVTGATGLSGEGVLWIVDDPATLGRIYVWATHYLGLAAQTEGTVGEQSSLDVGASSSGQRTQLLFVRCQALVYLQGIGARPFDSAMLEQWARKIDGRVQASPVCL